MKKVQSYDDGLSFQICRILYACAVQYFVSRRKETEGVRKAILSMHFNNSCFNDGMTLCFTRLRLVTYQNMLLPIATDSLRASD